MASNGKKHSVKKDTIIHFVDPKNEEKFIWGFGSTLCGLSIDQIKEYDSSTKYINCKKCLKILLC